MSVALISTAIAAGASSSVSDRDVGREPWFQHYDRRRLRILIRHIGEFVDARCRNDELLASIVVGCFDFVFVVINVVVAKNTSRDLLLIVGIVRFRVLDDERRRHGLKCVEHLQRFGRVRRAPLGILVHHRHDPLSSLVGDVDVERQPKWCVIQMPKHDVDAVSRVVRGTRSHEFPGQKSDGVDVSRWRDFAAVQRLGRRVARRTQNCPFFCQRLPTFFGA